MLRTRAMPHALDPYPDPDALDAERKAIAERVGAHASVYGESVEGRPLHALVSILGDKEWPDIAAQGCAAVQQRNRARRRRAS